MTMANSIEAQIELESIEDIIEEALEHEDGITDEDEDEDEDEGIPAWYPDEYVIMANGYRGQGKSLLVADIGLFYVAKNEVPVFTNMDYDVDRLKKEGYKNIPQILDWNALITFNLEQPVGALNQIDEVDTYLEKLRTASNQNVLATKFLEQIRKRTLKFILSCQFGHYLPYGTLDQVDIMIQAQDLFFSRSGRERGLEKGERFLYTCFDKSGYFTGGRRHPWFFTLKGKGIWGYYKTNKIHDPTQFAQKYEFEKNTAIVTAEGTFLENELLANKAERELAAYKDSLKLIWGSPIMGFVTKNKEELNVVEDQSHIYFTIGRMEQILSKHKGKAGKELDSHFRTLLDMSKTNGVVKRTGPNKIAIMKQAVLNQESDPVNPIAEDLLLFEKPYE